MTPAQTPGTQDGAKLAEELEAIMGTALPTINNELIRRVVAALRQPPAAVAQGTREEPVAWLIEDALLDETHCTTDEWEAANYAGANKAKVTPLYAAPPRGTREQEGDSHE